SRGGRSISPGRPGPRPMLSRRLSPAEAAPRLLHLLQLSWLLSLSSLGDGRPPMVAKRFLAVAEAAYADHHSAWRLASRSLTVPPPPRS
ncbi:unnamed protein product, partial [Discosporangium mesarthrocarpum]